MFLAPPRSGRCCLSKRTLWAYSSSIFFFHIAEGLTLDDDEHHFTDLAEAKTKAIRLLSEMAKDAGSAGTPFELEIELFDGQQKSLCSVPLECRVRAG